MVPCIKDSVATIAYSMLPAELRSRLESCQLGLPATSIEQRQQACSCKYDDMSQVRVKVR